MSLFLDGIRAAKIEERRDQDFPLSLGMIPSTDAMGQHVMRMEKPVLLTIEGLTTQSGWKLDDFSKMLRIG
jgi:hypothetical protein